jgi:tetratricopeptide (TPR) repeat protein
MVLPAPPAHATPVEPPWFDKLVVAIELSNQGVLTLVDNAAPTRLREVYLRLRARDPATELIVDVHQLAALPPGATVILALTESTEGEDLDWLNLNRPIVADRRYNLVLWCEDDSATLLARRAPDFFDWISARVDCPPAPAAHAVAEIRHALCARASGIAWAGPGLEETLAAVRPGRPVRRVAVASYQSMIDALTSHEPGWLFLDGIDNGFHLRRLRWAMAETDRRVIVFRHALSQTAPGWWTVHANYVSIEAAVHMLSAAGGTGRLVGLTGLDPDACLYARFALRRGIDAARLEDLLAAAADPRAALQDLARQSGWTAAEVLADQDLARRLIFAGQDFSGTARHERDGDPIVVALRGRPMEAERWTELGGAADAAGDFEVAIRWLTAALRSLPDHESSPRIANLHMLRGMAHHHAGDVAAARVDLDLAHSLAQGASDALMIVRSAVSLANVLLDQGEPSRARACLESALRTSASLDNELDVAFVLDMLARVLVTQGDLAGARQYLEQALEIKRRIFATEDHPFIAFSLSALGGGLMAQGDLARARPYFQQALEIIERVAGTGHPLVAAMLRALAGVELAQGNLERSRAHLERALSLQRIALGAEHPEVAATLVEWARTLAAQGDLEGAQAAQEHALAIQQNALGNDGRLPGATTRRALADVLLARGDLTGACLQLERALATQREIFGRDDHPAITATRHDLERMQQMQHDLQRTD